MFGVRSQAAPNPSTLRPACEPHREVPSRVKRDDDRI